MGGERECVGLLACVIIDWDWGVCTDLAKKGGREDVAGYL